MLQVGPGVKDLAEGDVVLTQQPLMGTWREAAVWPAKQLLKVGTRPAAGAHSRSTTPTEAAAAAADSQGQAGGEAAAAAGSARAGGQAAAGAGKAAAGGGGEGAVWEESLPLPLEYLAVSRELVVAYQLLAEHGDLKVRLPCSACDTYIHVCLYLYIDRLGPSVVPVMPATTREAAQDGKGPW
jgi:hypothetical protein